MRKRRTGALRVVLDASAKAKDNHCLNDRLFTGPRLQPNVHDALLGFRESEVAFVTDIKAMFSRIRLTPEDARLHQYLWREPGSKKITVFKMNRVTFGNNASPCLAIAVTRRAAQEFGQDKPLGRDLIERCMYVDDGLVSRATTAEAVQSAVEAMEILKPADFELRGWSSNCEEFRTQLRDRAGVDVGSDETTVLGLRWDPATDLLRHTELAGHSGEYPVQFTKRNLLSILAGVFSPLGLAAPFVVAGKI